MLLNYIKCSKCPPLTWSHAQNRFCHFIPSSTTLFQATPDLCQTLLQCIDVMTLMSVANVSVHESMPKEDILASNVSQEYTNN